MKRLMVGLLIALALPVWAAEPVAQAAAAPVVGSVGGQLTQLVLGLLLVVWLLQRSGALRAVGLPPVQSKGNDIQ